MVTMRQTRFQLLQDLLKLPTKKRYQRLGKVTSLKKVKYSNNNSKIREVHSKSLKILV